MQGHFRAVKKGNFEYIPLKNGQYKALKLYGLRRNIRTAHKRGPHVDLFEAFFDKTLPKLPVQKLSILLRLFSKVL